MITKLTAGASVIPQTALMLAGCVSADRDFTQVNLDTQHALGRHPPQEIRVNGDSMPRDLAHKIYHQVIQFFLIAFYLFVVFGVLALHEEVVAAKNGITYHFYGFAVINAIIFGKG